jgi:hypothetical protein
MQPAVGDFYEGCHYIVALAILSVFDGGIIGFYLFGFAHLVPPLCQQVIVAAVGVFSFKIIEAYFKIGFYHYGFGIVKTLGQPVYTGGNFFFEAAHQVGGHIGFCHIHTDKAATVIVDEFGFAIVGW